MRQRIEEGVGAAAVRDLRGRVERLEGALVEHRELQRLLAEEVSRLEGTVRSVSQDDGGAAR
jgi:hypothetical protein